MLIIVRPGVLTTVQDGGRQGVQAWGVTPGGAVDDIALRVGNAIVGNAPDAAALEMTWQGAHIRFECDTLIALTGASIRLGDGVAPSWRPLWIKAGTTLELGALSDGARSYLCVQGGVITPKVLGSCGTDLRNGFGGIQGRALRAGDRVAIAAQDSHYPGLWRVLSSAGVPYAAPRWQLSVWRDWPGPTPLLLLAGDALSRLPASICKTWYGQPFKVLPDSDRQGLRLQGLPWTPELPREASAGVCFGLVQLPPDGCPIVLLADHQTTGGYPVLGVVAAVGRSRLAQARPGDTLKFAPISLAQAHAALLARELRLQQLQRMLCWQMQQ